MFSPESQKGSRDCMGLAGLTPRCFHSDLTYRVRFVKWYFTGSLPEHTLSSNLTVCCGHQFVETQEG